MLDFQPVWRCENDHCRVSLQLPVIFRPVVENVLLRVFKTDAFQLLCVDLPARKRSGSAFRHAGVAAVPDRGRSERNAEPTGDAGGL